MKQRKTLAEPTKQQLLKLGSGKLEIQEEQEIMAEDSRIKGAPDSLIRDQEEEEDLEVETLLRILLKLTKNARCARQQALLISSLMRLLSAGSWMIETALVLPSPMQELRLSFLLVLRLKQR